MQECLKVINLDRTPQRIEQFRLWNPNFLNERFSAIDGARLSVMDLIRDGVISAENEYVPGALGTAMSHITLWRRCAAGGEPYHIVEDDIILRTDFWSRVSDLLATVPNWDIVLWTHNFDWPVMVVPDANIGAAVIRYVPRSEKISLASFRNTSAPSSLFPLTSAAAIACYSISPAGAKRMLEACLPIGNVMAGFAMNSMIGWRNSGLDVEMSRHYAKLRSFIAIPPLALAPNDHDVSTIRGKLAAV